MSSSWKVVRSLILGDIAEKGPGSVLQSDGDYAARANVSVTTVKRAMADLAAQGLIRRRRGRRTAVLAPPTVVTGSALSFRQTAANVYGHAVATKVMEQTIRLPRPGEYEEYELRAQESLGLGRDDPLIVLIRRRILSGETRAVHRSYLNPALLPATFLVDHDFQETSLLEILTGLGFDLRSRQTRIRSKLPTDAEAHLFLIDREPVLDVEQILIADHDETQTVRLEYLHATYCRWEYVINDRL